MVKRSENIHAMFVIHVTMKKIWKMIRIYIKAVIFFRKQAWMGNTVTFNVLQLKRGIGVFQKLEIQKGMGHIA